MAVAFRHRRRPPVLAFAIAAAVMLGVLSFGVQNPYARAALILAGLVALALGWLGRERLWVEDQLVTDEAVAVVRQDGSMGEIPFDRIARIAWRGTGLAFVRDDGRELAFARNPHRKRLERILRERAPSAQWVDEVPIACDT
jgi:ribosomal protein L24E